MKGLRGSLKRKKKSKHQEPLKQQDVLESEVDAAIATDIDNEIEPTKAILDETPTIPTSELIELEDEPSQENEALAAQILISKRPWPIRLKLKNSPGPSAQGVLDLGSQGTESAST